MIPFRFINLTHHRALQDEHKLQLQFKTLQEQIKDFKLRGKNLKQNLMRQTCTTETALKEYAKIDCRQLCDAVYQVFPREMRDIIYGHVHSQQEMLVGNLPFSRPLHCINDGYFASRSEAHWRLGPDHPDEKHLWDAESIGEGMLQELMEHYYHSVEFQFSNGFDSIAAFQTTDQWNMGFIPADFVTNVTFTVHCNFFDFDSRPGWDAPCRMGITDWTGNMNESCECPRHNLDLIPRTPRAQLLLDLQALFGFKQGTKMHIYIKPGRIEDPPKGDFAFVRERIIPAIFSALQRLRSIGYNVKISFSAGDWHVSRDIQIVLDDSTPTIALWQAQFNKVSYYM
jgi:hypothetical protein